MKKSHRLGWFLFLFIQVNGFAQKEKLHYWKDIPGFLDAQTVSVSKEIQAVLQENPPMVNLSASRKLALFSIDQLLHDTRLDTTQAIRSFIKDRMQLVLEDLKKPLAGTGTRIYKLYNQGFLVRTPSITMGFDLVMARTPHGELIDSAQMRRIVNGCDVLFVSHLHGDHADLQVARMFAALQKEVFVPTGLWEGEHPFIQPLRDTGILNRKITLKRGKTFEVKVFPGHQDETVLNNIYSVTTKEGFSVMHTGDQYNKKDLEWITQIGKTQKTDVLLLHCWMHDIEDVVKGIAPKLVISGHENEMAHTVDHREPYWLTLRRMKSIISPFLVMAWGESFQYK